MLRLFLSSGRGRGRDHASAPQAVLVALAIASCVALAPSRAVAQVCDEGRVSGPDTAGRCCWPGQVWSVDESACAGVPACPSPWVAHGDGCAPPMIAAPPVPEMVAVGVPIPARADAVYVPSPEAAAELTVDHDPHPRFVARGAAGVFVSWTLTATIAPMLAIFGLGENPSFYLLELVPVLGPLLAPAAASNSGIWWVYGALASTLQLTGWITLIVGLVNRGSTDTVRARADGLGISF